MADANLSTMILSGDSNVPAMPVTEAQVNHLRRLLAWLRCEYTLDDDMQRGYLLGAHESVTRGLATPEAASAIIQQKSDEINRVPSYVQQAVRMLTKAVREHEGRSGVVDEARPVRVCAVTDAMCYRQCHSGGCKLERQLNNVGIEAAGAKGWDPPEQMPPRYHDKPSSSDGYRMSADGLTRTKIAPDAAAPMVASQGVTVRFGGGQKPALPFNRKYVHAYLQETLADAVGGAVDQEVQRFMSWLADVPACATEKDDRG